MQFDREELLSVLTDANPALAKAANIPGLDHFWFDGEYVYAYDGGLGVRVAFKSELDCGLPGKALLDLLKTSALKQVDLDITKTDVVLKMGKAKVNLVSLDLDRMAWNFPIKGKKGYIYPNDKNRPAESVGTLELTEQVLDAITRVSFLRGTVDKDVQPRVVHQGVTIVPQKDSLEFYTTDSTSIARVSVKGKPPKGLEMVVAPWAFVDRVLELAEPGAKLQVLEDCLIVEGDGIQVCSNLLEIPEDPNLSQTLAYHLRDDQDPVAELPAGLQPVLDRVEILAGPDEAVVRLTTEGKLLILDGNYALGSLDEELPLKVKLEVMSASFVAKRLRRGLGQAKFFIISQKAIAFDDDESFVYVVAAKYSPKKEAAKEKRSEEGGVERRKPKITRGGRGKEMDDEIPF